MFNLWGYLVRGIQGVSLIQTIIGILFILTVIMGIKWLCAGSVVEPKQPVPVVLEKLVVPVCEKGFLGCKSHNALVKVTVRNNGDPGKVTIGAYLEDAEESEITPKQTEVHYMRKNEKKTYEINFKNLKLCPENTKWNPEVKVRSTP